MYAQSGNLVIKSTSIEYSKKLWKDPRYKQIIRYKQILKI